MGKRGPAPRPTALKLLQGEDKNRINANEPRVRDADPQPPADMSPDALAVWRKTLKELGYMRIASPSDADALACYCEAVVLHQRASKELIDSALVVRSERGYIKNPLIAVQRDAAATVRAFAQQFGLTPSARSGIRMPEATDDEKERLLS